MRAYTSQGGPIHPEAGLSVLRRAYPSRGGPIPFLMRERDIYYHERSRHAYTPAEAVSEQMRRDSYIKRLAIEKKMAMKFPTHAFENY